MEFKKKIATPGKKTRSFSVVLIFCVLFLSFGGLIRGKTSLIVLIYFTFKGLRHRLCFYDPRDEEMRKLPFLKMFIRNPNHR